MWGEDLIQLERHQLALVQKVQDSVIVGVKGYRVGCFCTLAILLCNGADPPENTDVSLEKERDAGMVSAPSHSAATPLIIERWAG